MLRRTVSQFERDSLTDWAAALTYYSVMSIFPGLVVLTALLGLMGPSATQTLIDNINTMVPGQGRDVLVNAIRELQGSGAAGVLAIERVGQLFGVGTTAVVVWRSPAPCTSWKARSKPTSAPS